MRISKVSPSKRKPLSVNSAPVTPASSAKKRLFKRDTSRYMEAKKALSTAVPEVLVGRKEQMDVMRNFLQDALVKKTKTSAKKSLYISGAPGTAFVQATGTVERKALKSGETLVVDSYSLVAWHDATLGVRPVENCVETKFYGAFIRHRRDTRHTG